MFRTQPQRRRPKFIECIAPPLMRIAYVQGAFMLFRISSQTHQVGPFENSRPRTGDSFSGSVGAKIAAFVSMRLPFTDRPRESDQDQ